MTEDVEGLRLRSRLAHLASSSSELSVSQLRLIVAIERVVARMQTIPALAKHLIFKGGFVLLKTLETTRFTKDIDAVALGIDGKEVSRLIKQALDIDLKDGLWYGNAEVHELKSHRPYAGWQVIVPYQIGKPTGSTKKLSKLNIDIGVGDSVPKNLKHNRMSTLLPGNPISWKVYPPEYILSEKLEALFQRGATSSRAKDIFDISLLSKTCTDFKKVKSAISNTFEHRNTLIPTSFFDYASSIDLEILKEAWPSVNIFGTKPEFEVVWEQVLGYLKQLDRHLK